MLESLTNMANENFNAINDLLKEAKTRRVKVEWKYFYNFNDNYSKSSCS